jgi:hypothetical protein
MNSADKQNHSRIVASAIDLIITHDSFAQSRHQVGLNTSTSMKNHLRIGAEDEIIHRVFMETDAEISLIP